MATSIFDEKLVEPDKKQFSYALGDTTIVLDNIFEFITKKYPEINDEWKFYNKKSGWIFKVYSKKRAIFYLVPREGFFIIAFILGDKATDRVIASNLPDDIKQTLINEKKYMEGRALRLEVKNEDILENIKTLIEIKMSK